MKQNVPTARADFASRLRRAFSEFLWMPGLTLIGATGVALVILWLDTAEYEWIRELREPLAANIFQNASSTKSFLETSATGLLTMTSITFSMLLLALQQSASLIGAQVVYSFLLRRRNQILLSYFLGVTLFTLIVAAFASDEFHAPISAFVVLLMMAGSLFGLALLVFTAVNQMRPQVVIGEVRTLTLEARQRQKDLLLASWRTPQYRGGTEVAVTTEDRGYLRDVDVEQLRRALQTRKVEAEIEILPEIGNYVAYGEVMARVRAETRAEAERLAQVTRAALRLDYRRAVKRDPSFGIEQLLMIGWSSGSTAEHNPGVAAESVRNLRDIAARWAETYESVEQSDGEIPLVYPDGLMKRVFDAFQALAGVSSESLQTPLFEEVLHAYILLIPRLPEELLDQLVDSLGRLMTALGDLVMTRMLDEAMEKLAVALSNRGREEAAARIRDAKREMASLSWGIEGRSTRAQEAGKKKE